MFGRRKRKPFSELRLYGYDGSMLVMVRRDAFHFCHIYIVRDNRAFFLGGAPFNNLRDAFAGFLKVSSVLVPQHEPRDASKTHIMNVSGWLGSIYGELLDSGKWRLHFYSSRNESFPTIDLSVDDLKEWLEAVATMELMGSKDPLPDSSRLGRIEKKLWHWKRKLFRSRKREKPDFRTFKEVRLEAINGSLIFMISNTRYGLGTVYLSLNNSLIPPP